MSQDDAAGTGRDLTMHLTLHLTPACNMRCSYCYSPPTRGESMSLQTGQRALRLGAGLTEGSCGIIFFGGEPLLCKDLVKELISYGRTLERSGQGQFHFKLTTNGLSLDEQFIEFSLRENLLIAMSFDGIREAHDRHRRLPDGRPSFDLVRPRLEMLLAMRPYASVMVVVNPDTAKHLSESVTFLMDHSVKYLIVSLNYAGTWTESDLADLQKELKKLGRLYVRWTEENRKFYLSPFEVKLSSHINKHCYRKERCEFARRQISVDPQGFLFPCVQFTRAGSDSEWCIGHVDRGIDEGVRGRIHDASERDKAFCKDCGIKERCNNSCGCLNWQTTGSINEISPVLCRCEQMMAPIADEVGKTLYRKRNPLFLHKHYNAAYPFLSLLEDTLDDKS